MNRLLAALEETDSGIRNLRELDGEWRQKKDLLALERSMEEKKRSSHRSMQGCPSLNCWKRARAAWKAVREAEERLGELEGLHPFPGNGLARLERLKDEKVACSGPLREHRRISGEKRGEIRTWIRSPAEMPGM